MKTKMLATLLIAAAGLGLGGCDYDVPLTARPTRPIDERLLGDWVAKEPDNKDGKDGMKVRKLDDFTYIVSINGDLCRAFHSEVGGVPFISAQDLDSADRKYAYLTYQVSADGTGLILRMVSTKVLALHAKNSADMQKELEKNLHNPDLLEQEIPFTREKRGN